MHFSNGRFSNKETGFSGPYVVWSLLGAPGEKKKENQMYLQDFHAFAPLESQVENYLEKNLPENPKENERTRPHGKVEKVETKGDAWNSA